ncbi:hypothetical protein ACFQ2H_20600 [Streptomyces violaceoruber]
MPVAGPALRLADVLLQGVAHDRAVGQPVRQARAHEGVGVEQRQFAAQPPVVVVPVVVPGVVPVVHGGLLGTVHGTSTT